MLASKISCLLVVSLAFLLGALLVMPSQGQSWPAFRNKHIDSSSQYPPPNINAYCATEMQRRGMTSPRCKPRNTFIFAIDTVVKQVCGNIVGPVAITSGVRFDLVDCNNKGTVQHCNYEGTIERGKKIVVTCENKVPVHFIRFI